MKESSEEYMGRFGGRKEKGNVVIILNLKNKIKKFMRERDRGEREKERGREREIISHKHA